MNILTKHQFNITHNDLLPYSPIHLFTTAMITTKTIKLNRPDQFDNLWIENKLSELGFDVIRWAIVDINDKEISISVSTTH